MPIDLQAPLAILIIFCLTVSLTSGGIAIGAEKRRWATSPPIIVLIIRWTIAFVGWPVIASVGLYNELTKDVPEKSTADRDLR